MWIDGHWIADAEVRERLWRVAFGLVHVRARFARKATFYIDEEDVTEQFIVLWTRDFISLDPTSETQVMVTEKGIRYL